MISLNRPNSPFRNQTLMTEQRARSFAALLRGNANFTDVAVQLHPTAKGAARWFVSYAPSSQARRAELHEVFQDVQDARAAGQWENYAVSETETPGVYAVKKLASGETYTVDLHPAGGGACTCETYRWRCAAVKARCKHSKIAATHRSFGLVRNGGQA